MKYITLPQTNLKVSVLCLGTWVFGGQWWGGAQGRQAEAAVAAAFDAGINFVDTAPVYGYGVAEEIVGRAIKKNRNQWVVATKCGLVGKGREMKKVLTPDSIQQEVEASLRRLQTDYIDLYQCHWPDVNTPFEVTFEVLRHLQSTGKIRYIGVSNYTGDALKEVAAAGGVVTAQNQYSLLERGIEQDVLPIMQEASMGVLTYGTLAGGILSGKYQEPPQFDKADVRKFFYKYYEGTAFKKTQALLERLKTFGHPLVEVAINWVRQQNGVSSVIVGCRNVQQVQSNEAALEWELSSEQLALIKEGFLGC